jgi:hypothetical protein
MVTLMGELDDYRDAEADDLQTSIHKACLRLAGGKLQVGDRYLNVTYASDSDGENGFINLALEFFDGLDEETDKTPVIMEVHQRIN